MGRRVDALPAGVVLRGCFWGRQHACLPLQSDQEKLCETDMCRVSD